MLYEFGGLHKDDARAIIWDLHCNDPLYITKEIVNHALSRLGIDVKEE